MPVTGSQWSELEPAQVAVTKSRVAAMEPR